MNPIPAAHHSLTFDLFGDIYSLYKYAFCRVGGLRSNSFFYEEVISFRLGVCVEKADTDLVLPFFFSDKWCSVRAVLAPPGDTSPACFPLYLWKYPSIYFNSLNIYWVFILDFDVYFCMEGIFVPLDFHPNIVSLQKCLAFHQLRQSWMRLTGKEIP